VIGAELDPIQVHHQIEQAYAVLPLQPKVQIALLLGVLELLQQFVLLAVGSILWVLAF